jgi:hypothetical protein
MRLLAGRRLLLIPSVLAMMSGCSDVRNPYLYVPGEGYSCTVNISLPNEAKVGEWIPLKASRRCGPWRQVRRSEVTDEAKAYPKQPPEFENDVEANLRWLTDPPNVGRFNVATAEDITRNPLERKVRFNQAGVYKIWAITAYPTTATSNVETITILQGK